MKKVLALCLSSLVVSGAIGLASCGDKKGSLKVGVVCIGDETATYDLNFIHALDRVKEAEGVQVFYKYNTSEDGDASYQAAVDLAESGCDIIIANSYGFEDNIIKAAKEYKDIQFIHCSGDKAHTTGLANYANGFSSIYEGRYLAGIAAGMKLNAMGEKTMGYVGAFDYAEVISGFTAFYLGAKSVCADVTMMVQYTGSWGNTNLESAAATNLLSKGAKLISQHADTYGAPSVCDAKGVANVSYNVSTESKFPETYLCYSAIDWTPYFTHVVQKVKAGEHVEADYTATLKDGGVSVGTAGKCAAEGTQKAMDDAKAELIAGTKYVFDCSTFTVDLTREENKFASATVDAEGHILTAKANVNNDDAVFSKETEVVTKIGEKTVYEESTKRSAPYFDLIVDGITIVK